jgi:hypothetical protein
MATREELAEHLWQAIINPHLDPLTLDRVVAHCRRFPSDYLSGVGPAIERARAAGVSDKDLCLLSFSVAYEAVFGTLYAIGDPGVDGDDVLGLYEILGGAPSADKTPGAT